jgi:SAM-dependent methyltransferase
MSAGPDRAPQGPQPEVTQPPAGPASLENHLGGAEGQRYRRYQRDLIAPYIGRSVLEIGSGLGDFSAQFGSQLDYLAVSDNDPYCLARLAERYQGRADVDVLELALPGDIPVSRTVDTVVLMNVLEHIADDAQALSDLAACLAPDGRIVIWVPGYMQLYGDFDRLVGHCRRYTPATLRQAVVAAGLEAEMCRPVNFIGGIAWWLTVRRFGVRHASPRLARIYDATVVPVTRAIERVFQPSFGQSVICVARIR